jgi:ABC-type nitrate/sulfonate/bicarbonate transport system substrate-binding protein
MRKIMITAVAAMAMAAAFAGTASAAVERCQVTTTVTAPSVTTATFKVFEPAGTKDSFDNFYTTDYTVTVNADGTFEGTGLITGYDAPSEGVPTTITGTFDRAHNTVSYVAKPADTDNHISWKLDNGVTDGITVNSALALNSQEGPSVGVNFKVTTPDYVTTPGATSITTTEYKNHGEYVSKLGGGKIAAQACQGMPVVSTQGKS